MVRHAIHASDSFGLLLVLLLCDYTLLSLVDTGRWFGIAVGIPLSLTVLLALRTSHASHHHIRLAVLAVAVSVIAGGVNVVVGSTIGEGSIGLLLALLLVVTPFAVLRRILGHRTVTVETILGAICIYILIGIVFTMVFYGISRSLPLFYGSPVPTRHWFLAQPPALHPPADYLYLSFVTLTTVGFGDLTPLNQLARSVVVLEAIIGQIFLVTLVSRMVALYGQERPEVVARDPAGDPGGGAAPVADGLQPAGETGPPGTGDRTPGG
jgi:hypothetical protein